MMNDTKKQNPVTRMVLIVIGLLLIGLAIFGRRAHLIGFEEVGGMQLALLGLSTLLISIAIFREHFIGVYQSMAVLLLNTLLLLLIVELIVIFSFNLQLGVRATRIPVQAEVPYFHEQTWGQTLWEEQTAASELATYRPYILWKLRAYEGTLVNIDENGQRVVPQTDCANADAYTIFIFGGSTMWGMGAPDWGTIPAYLQDTLTTNSTRPICIVNYGVFSYVSTQEVLRLMLEARSSNVPDLAIFYDGINDTIAAFNAGTAGEPRSSSNLEQAFRAEPSRTSLWGWVNSTYIARLIAGLRQPPPQPPAPEVAQMQLERENQLANDILSVYESNYRLAEFLGAEYGFDVLFIWQPTLVVGEKVMTPDEELAAQAPPPGLLSLYQKVWADAATLADELPHMVYLGDIFDGVETYAYYDHVHLVPEGNQIIGEAIANLVITYME